MCKLLYLILNRALALAGITLWALLSTFIDEVKDIERRGKAGEKVRMVVEDKDGNAMKDRDDQRKPAEAYLGSNMMALKPDYGKLNFNNLKEVADYKLPVKIGKTLDGEDVYQMKPFLTIHREPQDLRGTRLGGGRKKRRTVKKKRK